MTIIIILGMPLRLPKILNVYGYVRECVCVFACVFSYEPGMETLQFRVYLWKFEEKQNHNPTAIIMIWPIIDSDRMTVAFVSNTNCAVMFKCSKNILEIFWNWVACREIKTVSIVHTHIPYVQADSYTRTRTKGGGEKAIDNLFHPNYAILHHLFFDSIKSK